MNIALFDTRYQVGRVRGLGVLLLVFAMLAALLPASVLAASSVTSATGGSAISADTAATSPGSNSYTPLTGPSIIVTSAGNIGTGSITITVPSGFEFATSPNPVVSVGATGAVVSFTSASTSVLTFTVTVANTDPGTVVFSGIRVVPTVGTPLASGELQVGGSAGVSDATAGSLTEVAGAAELSYQTAPSTSATAGTALVQQPVVLSQDQFGNVRSGDSILLSSVASTGGLSCTTNPKATIGSGLASFTACTFTNNGSYVIRASVAGGTPVDSATITVAPAPATKLVFTTQPGHGTPSAVLSPQPVVAIQDAFGNTVASASATILLAKLAPDLGGPGTLVGCSTAPTVNGVATFSGCRIDTVGVGYRLTATDTTGGGVPHPYTLATSTKFDVADRLLFTTQPSGATAGTAFTTQPVVAVKAGATNTAANDSSTVVTLSLKAGTGTAGAALTCDSGLSKTVVAGLAAFTGCKIDKISPTSPANPYTIVASATNLTSAESTNVAITASAASKLGFTAQPTSASSNQAFPIQPVVAVQDLGGNTVTSGLNSNATITLAIGTNPAAGTLTCTSGLTMVAVAGVAAFAGCQINNAGVGYTLTATATGLTGTTSTSFTVGAPAAAITLTTSASVITWGTGIVLTTQFGTGGAARSFQLQGTRDGVTWVTIVTLTTDAFGRSAFAYRPVTNNWYRVVFAGAPDLSGATSASVRTVVRQIALLRPKNSGAIRSIARNTSITFTTTVRPARPELAPAKVSFSFYRMVSGSWRLIAKRDVYIDALGLARTTFKFTSSGQWYVRSAANPTTYNANSIPSPVERYNVY
jgi:trimeric autotransporter adhesin